MNNVFGGALGVLQDEAKTVGKAALQQLTGISDDKKKQQATQQSRKAGSGSAGQDSIENLQNKSQQQSSPTEAENSKQATADFVKELYESDEPPITPDQIKIKEAEDKQKTEALRQKLHSEYYQKLITPTQQQEERPAEKVERQEMEDLQKKQEEDQKKRPIAVDRAEKSTEMFRGASG